MQVLKSVKKSSFCRGFNAFNVPEHRHQRAKRAVQRPSVYASNATCVNNDGDVKVNAEVTDGNQTGDNLQQSSAQLAPGYHDADNAIKGTNVLGDEADEMPKSRTAYQNLTSPEAEQFEHGGVYTTITTSESTSNVGGRADGTEMTIVDNELYGERQAEGDTFIDNELYSVNSESNDFINETSFYTLEKPRDVNTGENNELKNTI